MVKKQPVSKASQTLKATKSVKKKSWTKGREKSTVKRNVYVEDKLFEKIQKEIQTTTLITKTSVAEKYNLNAGVAQKLIEHFCSLGLIKLIAASRLIKIYSKITVKVPTITTTETAEEK